MNANASALPRANRSAGPARALARDDRERRTRVLEHYSEAAAAALQLSEPQVLNLHLNGRVCSPQNDATLRLLARLPLFAGMGRDDLAAVRSMCRGRHSPIGSRLFEQGDPSAQLYMLLSGSVRIAVAGAGRVHEVLPGEVFGEIGFVTRDARSASAEALEDCTLLAIDYARLDALGEARPAFAARLTRNIAAAIAGHVLRMNQFQTLEHLVDHKSR